MSLRRLLRLSSAPAPATDDCLAAFTTTEVQAAADYLDRGNPKPADDLVDRAPAGHERCMAFAVLQRVTVAPEEG